MLNVLSYGLKEKLMKKTSKNPNLKVTGKPLGGIAEIAPK